MTPRPPASLEIAALSHRYRGAGAYALDDVSFEVKPGERVGLLGPNGAGKSTLIQTLLGFHRPTSGTARLLGEDIRRAGPDLRDRIGYMPENEAFIPGMSAVRFVRYMGELSGLPRAVAIERAHATLYYVGLGEARYREVQTFSLGMKQTAKLAQALVHSPRLIFLDEPTNGLDPEGIVEIRNLLLDMARTGTTIFISSHILAEISRLADRIGIIHKGKLVRELHAHELNRQRTTSLRLRTRDNPKAREALLNQGFPAIQIHPSWIEIKDERAIQNPSSLTRWLSLQDLPPEEIYIFKEDLEHFFLRTLQIENQDD